MPKIQTLRGMNDINPEETKEFSQIELTLKSIVESYGYDEIRFPLIEKTELYTRSNEAADIVTKEMYTFDDKSGESISLRPEGTAGCVRAAINNDLLRTDKPRLWYCGPMFRYERPQKGRSRQFHQFSVEVFGLDSPEIDAELIAMSSRFWKVLGISEEVYLEINNLGNDKARSIYSDSLVNFLNNSSEQLDEDSKKKLENNPLRILDSKNPVVQKILKNAPTIEDFVEKDSKNHHDRLLEILENLNISYKINSKLVRGLDYYNQTVFEWKSDLLGSQDTILGGGRYDNLVGELGGKHCPAVGFSLGLERLILLLREQNKIKTVINLDIYFICLCERSSREAIIVSEKLKEKIPNLSIKINLGLESINSQFKKADKSGAKIALIIGDKELEDKKISYKNLRATSEQESLDFDDLLKRINQIK